MARRDDCRAVSLGIVELVDIRLFPINWLRAVPVC